MMPLGETFYRGRVTAILLEKSCDVVSRPQAR